MLSNKLIKILKERSTEERILRKVKKALEADKKSSLNVGKGRHGLPPESPLSVAAENGFCSVLKYLMEESSRKADPNEILFGNQTALGIALCNRQFEAALYLAQHTTAYPQDIKWGYTSLHYAAGRDQAEIVDAILSMNPSIINLCSKEGLSALHLSVEHNASEAVNVLLKHHADLSLRTNQDATAYGLALSIANSQIISKMLEYPEHVSPLEYIYFSIRLLPLRLVMDNENSAKLPAVITLLEAGAGLDLNRVPKTVFDLLQKFGRPRTAEWEFLIVGNHKLEADRRAQKIFVTNLSDFEAFLDKPEIKFNLRQIAHSTQHPAVCHLPYVQRIHDLVKSRCREALPVSVYQGNITDVDFVSVIAKESSEDIRKLNQDEFYFRYESEEKLFERETQELITHIDSIFKILKSASPEDQANFDARHIFDKYLIRLHEVLAFITHKRSDRLDGLNSIRTNFTNVFTHTLALITIPSFEQYATKMMAPFVNKLSRVVQVYARDLRVRAPNFYNMLLDAKVCANLEMARGYIQSSNFDLAQTLAEEAIYQNSKILANNEVLSRSIRQSNAQALILLVQVHIGEGRFRAAFECFEKMLRTSYDALNVCRGVGQAMSLILEQHQVEVRPRVIQILRDVISYLSHFNSEIENSIYYSILSSEIKYIERFRVSLISLENQMLDARLSLFREKLSAFGQVEQFDDRVAYQLYDRSLHDGNRKRYARYLKQCDELNACLKGDMFEFHREYLLSQTFEFDLNHFTEILNMPKPGQAELLSDLSSRLDRTVKQLDKLSFSSKTEISDEISDVEIQPKIKIKTKGIANPELNKKRKKCTSKVELSAEPNEFHIPEGYMRPIPIQGGHLGEHHLFMTLPKEDPRFETFYKLIQGDVIHSISEYGKGQQGVKLGKTTMTDEKGNFQQVAIARLKICGGETLRAWGFVSQTVKTESGIRKLYLFKPEDIVDKKEEYRKGYKI